jgi:hypothetical protein
MGDGCLDEGNNFDKNIKSPFGYNIIYNHWTSEIIFTYSK